MAERRDLTEKELENIERMAGLGLADRQIAAILDMNPDTLVEIKKRDPRVAPCIERGRAVMSDKIRESAYLSALQGNTAMQIFILKTREGFRETQRLELTGADGEPIQTKKVLNPEERKVLLAKYKKLVAASDIEIDEDEGDAKTEKENPPQTLAD